MAGFKVSKGNSAYLNAFEICHVAAKGSEHALDLMIHALGDGDFTLAVFNTDKPCASADSAVLEDNPLLCGFDCFF